MKGAGRNSIVLLALPIISTVNSVNTLNAFSLKKNRESRASREMANQESNSTPYAECCIGLPSRNQTILQGKCVSFHANRRVGMWAALFIIFLVSLSFAGGMAKTGYALNSLSSGLNSLLPVAAMLMTVLAAVIYAAGQMLGAETRARANTWATAALTGAMMAVLITVIAPATLTAIYGNTVSGIDCGNLVPSGGCPAGQTEIFYHARAYGTVPAKCNLACGFRCGGSQSNGNFCDDTNPNACYFCIAN